MKLRTLPALLLLGCVGIGCKSGGTADQASNTTSTSSSNPSSSTDQTASSASTSGDTGSAASSDSGNSLVGNWTTDDPEMKGATFAFAADGSVDVSISFPSSEGQQIPVDMKSTYKMDDDKMIVHPISAEATAPDGADAKTKGEVEATNKQFASMKKPDETDTIAWKDKDTFTSTDSKGKVTTFTRKAS